MKLCTLLLGLLATTSLLAAENYVETVAGTGSSQLNIQEGSVKDFNIADPFGVEFGPDGRLYVT